jgi:hypothetical protein
MQMITLAQADAIIERMNAVQQLVGFDNKEAREEELRAINEELGQWFGEGQPRADLSETALAIGADYICALADGSILAWGADRAIGREIVIIDEPTDD